jgi:exosortase H (IPTLxxWG-CTERM-specific)
VAAMRRFFLSFVAILVVLFTAELTAFVQAAAVIPWTEGLARVSARLVQLFDGNVRAYGRVLQSTANGFAVSIEAGCNGVEAALMLVAAMLAFRAPWRHKLAGIVVGLVTVQALNVVRVVSLFYLGQWSRDAFEWAHLYIWQALIMLDVLVVWLLWLRWLPAQGEPMLNATAAR